MPIFRKKYRPIREDSGESKDKKKPRGRICKCPEGKLQSSHPRFGPHYREDEPKVSWKKQAWEAILEKSDDDQTLEKSERDGKIFESYYSAMRRIEKDTRDAYESGVLIGFRESEFRRMMIEDGCAFLQLTLLVLGASFEQLGHSEHTLIFGGKHSKEDFKKWIESTFFPGNQIPLVVLNELMKQSYFQNIVKKVQWEIPSDLSKVLLYELLILPALKCSNPVTTTPTSTVGLREKAFWSKQPLPQSDLLDALHCFIVRKGHLGIDQIENEDEYSDLEAGYDYEWSKEKTGSATELRKKGIRFCQVKEGGCLEISFTDYVLCAFLYLPVFTLDNDTELLFKNLIYYEISQAGQGEGKREVRSYLKLMSELICTYEDVKLLADNGIIKAKHSVHKEKLPRMLKKLVGEDMTTTEELHLLRIQLKDYNIAPWEKFKIVAVLAFIITIIQVIFAALNYIRPRR